MHKLLCFLFHLNYPLHYQKSAIVQNFYNRESSSILCHFHHCPPARRVYTVPNLAAAFRFVQPKNLAISSSCNSVCMSAGEAALEEALLDKMN